MTVHGCPCKRNSQGGWTESAGQGSRRAGPRVQGFTLVEILVTLALAGFGFLGFAGLLKVLGNLEAENTWKTKALFCADERLEELEFACLTGEAFVTDGGEEVEEGSYQGMRREWSVEDSAVFDGLLEITATCAYPWKGSMKTVKLSTLVFPEEG